MRNAKSFWLILVMISTASSAFADGPPDGWHYLTPQGVNKNPLFSEFKYFNFQAPGISGAMTYSVFAPGLLKTLQLNGYFYIDGKLVTVHRAYPLDGVRAQANQLKANFGGPEDGVVSRTANPGEMKIHVFEHTGQIQWDLMFTAPMAEVTSEVTEIPLGYQPRLAPLLRVQNMNWSPVFRSSLVEGTVTFSETGRVVPVRTTTIYHDENWENWIPQYQPFNWMHFTALDSAKERVDLMLVEFPNSTTTAAGLTIYSQGTKKNWPPGSYNVSIKKTGFIPITRHLGATAEQMQQIDVDPTFARSESATRQIPIEYEIKTDDDQVAAHMRVVAALSSTTTRARPAGSPPPKLAILDGVLVEEQVLDVSVRFLSHDGKARQAAGRGEFMNTANEP